MRWLRLVASGIATLSFALACAAVASPTVAAASPPARTPKAPVVPPGRWCSAVGCTSGVTIIAHVDASPETLAKGGSFTLCHQEECWDGVVRPPDPGNSAELYPCRGTGAGPFPVYGFVRAEGTGATMALRFASTKATQTGIFVDGDRIALRVDAAGKRLLDVIRGVKYDNVSPNGVACPGHCRHASVELWPRSPSGVTCTSAQCEPYVRFERTVPMTEEAAGPTTVTACKNGDCESTTLSLWAWENHHGKALRAGNSGFGDDRFDPMLDYGPNGKGGFALRVTFRGDTRAFQPGDTYSVDWWSPKTGKVLMKSDRVVTVYDETYPGGQECTPVACRQRTFSLH